MDGISITDLIWTSSNFVLDLKENKDLITLNPEQNEFSDKIPRPSKALVDIKQYKQLLEIKEKIQNCNHWDKWSKLTNPYDKISYLAKNKNTKDYYKFFEILKHFNISGGLGKDSPNINSSAHMGNSSLNSSKSLSYLFPNINWYANVEKKSFEEKNDKNDKKSKSQTELNRLIEIDLENSKDINGYPRIINVDPTLKTIDNLKNFREHVGKVDVIIGDCTIDTEHDPSSQEQLVFYYLFVQIVTALHMQLENGHLILKIFDTMTRPTCQIIYFLTNFYKHVSIIKPRTTRYTNSEKFIVARKFKNVSESELNMLDTIINKWNPEQYFRVLGIDIPEEIEKQFLVYNNILIDNQYKYIEKTINCNYNEEEIPDKQLEAFQNKIATQFCSNFGISVNLVDNDISVCKHIKKKKIQISTLKNSMVCEKCFNIVIGSKF